MDWIKGISLTQPFLNKKKIFQLLSHSKNLLGSSYQKFPTALSIQVMSFNLCDNGMKEVEFFFLNRRPYRGRDWDIRMTTDSSSKLIDGRTGYAIQPRTSEPCYLLNQLPILPKARNQWNFQIHLQKNRAYKRAIVWWWFSTFWLLLGCCSPELGYKDFNKAPINERPSK